MNKTTSIIVAAVIIVGTGYFITHDAGTSESNSSGKSNSSRILESTPEIKNGEENSIVKDGIQYVTISVHGGYSPRLSYAQGGIPTKLVMKTKETYDCSSALVIRSLGYRNILPNTGETIIDAGTPKKGDVLQGVCGMGMYSFAVEFK